VHFTLVYTCARLPKNHAVFQFSFRYRLVYTYYEKNTVRCSISPNDIGNIFGRGSRYFSPRASQHLPFLYLSLSFLCIADIMYVQPSYACAMGLLLLKRTDFEIKRIFKFCFIPIYYPQKDAKNLSTLYLEAICRFVCALIF
jgi:hypothetical protein